MENSATIYDVAIIGGGLAGLALSIQLAKKGYAVVLLEKETYPFHKVCGEYISMESWALLEGLGVPLQQLNVPIIDTFQLTSPNGKTFTTSLPLGGFGISRFLLDATLARMARHNGVTILEGAKVTDVIQGDPFFDITFDTKLQAAQKIQATLCCGAYGKRSNLDIKWKRDFLQPSDPRINNYVGVKYHIRANWPENVIGLHNFNGGYCGISKIEGEHYCLCYMTTAAQLKKSNHSIPQLEEQVLYQNPFLKTIFSSSHIVENFPVTISQISFSQKTQVQKGVLMLGDAAGMITPLCGNGMSMALHSSKIAALLIEEFLQKNISFPQLLNHYQQGWQAAFAARLSTGRLLQRFFGSNVLSNAFVQTFKTMPFLATGIIRKTHGAPF